MIDNMNTMTSFYRTIYLNILGKFITPISLYRFINLLNTLQLNNIK